MIEARFRRPESVLVVVHTLDGRALVLRRADQPDLWQSVTGSLRTDESPPAAARRELIEETGIDDQPQPSGILRRFRILEHWQPRFPPGTRWNWEHEFALALPSPVTVVLDPAEHLEFAWLGVEEAAQRVFSWTNREALEALA